MLVSSAQRASMRALCGCVASPMASSSGALRSFAVSTHLCAPPPSGFFSRPTTTPSTSLPRVTRKTEVAMPHTPPDVPKEQAPNYPTTWSESQAPRDLAMRGPRFEQMVSELQPQPLSAMEMIQREPIRLTTRRVVECDGGDGPMGHPRVFINLDKPGPKGCPYCGLRYEKSVEHH